MTVKLKSGSVAINKRMVVSGNIVEIYEYEKSIYCGGESSGGRNKTASGEKKFKNRADTLNRARKDVRRLVNANFGAYGREFTAKFVTLTFKSHVTEFETANVEFRKFVKRLNYNVYKTKECNLKYTVVPEFTKKGRIHFHVIFYNLPYLKADYVSETWGNGFIKINKIDQVSNVGAYICKYMTKDNDDERLHSKKSYFNSRGLFKPIEITQDSKIDRFCENLPTDKITYASEFENEYTGKIKYTQINLLK